MPAIGDEAMAELIESHNQRIELLGKIHSNGVIEFRWLDEDGREHFEPQVNAKLWIELPCLTALRAEKLDEVLLWLGSDEQRYWLFDLMGDEKKLHTHLHEEAAGDGEKSPLLIKPLALMDLLGLTPLPAIPPDEAGDGPTIEMSADSERRAWVVQAPGAGGPMRLFIDQVSRLPVRVETLSASGEVLMCSELRRYKSMIVPGISRAALPKIPTMIDIDDPDGSVSVKLALDEPTGDVEDQPWDRVFDLSRLMKAMRPDRILGDPPNFD